MAIPKPDPACTGLSGCPVHPDGLGLDGNVRTIDAHCVHCKKEYPCGCPEPEIKGITYDAVYDIAVEVLNDEDERGGPMQRAYPRAVIESMAGSIANRVMDLGAPVDEEGEPKDTGHLHTYDRNDDARCGTCKQLYPCACLSTDEEDEVTEDGPPPDLSGGDWPGVLIDSIYPDTWMHGDNRVNLVNLAREMHEQHGLKKKDISRIISTVIGAIADEYGD